MFNFFILCVMMDLYFDNIGEIAQACMKTFDEREAGKNHVFFQVCTSSESLVNHLCDEIRKCKRVKHVEYSGIYGVAMFSQKPTKEFKQLAAWLNKYAGYDLTASIINTQKLFGKRNWYKVTDMDFLCFHTKKCNAYLQELRKLRETGDIISIEKGITLDEGDRYNGNGEDREIEWYGSKEEYLTATIKTPRGKIRGQVRMFNF